MKCPVDDAVLQMTERSGVEIDYCPTCRGVWLDRGELDKILERAAAEGTGPVAAPPPPQPVQVPAGDPRGHRYHDDDDDDRYDRYDRDAYGRPRKKRKSFLSEMFDFD